MRLQITKNTQLKASSPGCDGRNLYLLHQGNVFDFHAVKYHNNPQISGFDRLFNNNKREKKKRSLCSMGFVTYCYLQKYPLNSTKSNRTTTAGWVFLSEVKLSSLNKNRAVHSLPRPQHRHKPGDAAGVQQLLSTNTDNTSPCLGALTSPSFRNVWDQLLWKTFYICLSTLHQPRPSAPFW